MKKLFITLCFGFVALFAQVEDKVEVPYIEYEIKMGKGFDVVYANCLTCHSFGYITNQGPQSRQHWYEKTMKMVDHFKAPISKEDVITITDYLAEHYGNGE